MSMSPTVVAILLLFLVEAIIAFCRVSDEDKHSPEPPISESTTRTTQSHSPSTSDARTSHKRKKNHSSKSTGSKTCSTSSKATTNGRRHKSGMADNTADEPRRSTRTKSRKPRSISPDISFQSRRNVNAPFEDFSGATQAASLNSFPSRHTSSPAHAEPRSVPQTETPPKSMTRPVHPQIAYIWFYTVRYSVCEHRRTDLLLEHGGVPLEFAFLLSLGWITLDKCLKWADGRNTIGDGLLDLHDAMNKSVHFQIIGSNERPSDEEVERSITSWMKTEPPYWRRTSYDWDGDKEERSRYGPLGKKVADLAPADQWEVIVALLEDSSLDLDLWFLTDKHLPIYTLLAAYRWQSAVQENTGMIDEEYSQELSEQVEPHQEGLNERDQGETGPNPAWDGAGENITQEAGSFTPTPPSTPASSPSQDDEEVLDILEEAYLQDDGKEEKSEDSQMDDYPVPSTGIPYVVGNPWLASNSFPYVVCEEKDEEMLPAPPLELSDDCDMQVSSNDLCISEPVIWLPAQPVFFSQGVADEEMQDSLPMPASISASQTMRPLPHTSSIEMEDGEMSSVGPFEASGPQNIPDIIISSPPSISASLPASQTPPVNHSNSPAQSSTPFQPSGAFSAPKPSAEPQSRSTKTPYTFNPVAALMQRLLLQQKKNTPHPEVPPRSSIASSSSKSPLSSSSTEPSSLSNGPSSNPSGPTSSANSAVPPDVEKNIDNLIAQKAFEVRQKTYADAASSLPDYEGDEDDKENAGPSAGPSSISKGKGVEVALTPHDDEAAMSDGALSDTEIIASDVPPVQSQKVPDRPWTKDVGAKRRCFVY